MYGWVAFCGGNEVAIDGFPVEQNLLDTVVYTVWVADRDVVGAAPELSFDLVLACRLGQAWVDEEPVVSRFDA